MPVPPDLPPSQDAPTGPANAPTHRQRRRASRPTGSPQREPKPTPPEPAIPDPAALSEKPADPKRRGTASRRDNGERAWRELAGSGPSQVGVDGALRARDVNRPTKEELAQAEHDVVIVRRNWRPDEH